MKGNLKNYYTPKCNLDPQTWDENYRNGVI